MLHPMNNIPPWLQPIKSDKRVDLPMGPVCNRRSIDSMLGANPDLTAEQAQELLRCKGRG